ncbi:MAG: SagB/ThcOx family dehydrogenase [Desulfurococcales archaeon]|nr:SagB/ThcOx family dehydrogenase [Desulfurococcales archaeon]
MEVENALRSIAGRRYLDRILKALALAGERRDPSVFYHLLSFLEEGYYGWDVGVKRDFQDFYKFYQQSPGISLPEPLEMSGVDVFSVIKRRRSRRVYSIEPVSLEELASILFYSVGVTGQAGWGGPKRVYPSAGGLQPVEAYVVVGRVEGLEAGLYHYHPGRHELEVLGRGDLRNRLFHACLEQDHVLYAPVSIVFTIIYPRTAQRYGVRAYRYALMDVGFAGENVYLVAEALGLATVAVGAFHDGEVCRLLGVDCEWEYPMLVFPVGKRVGD